VPDAKKAKSVPAKNGPNKPFQRVKNDEWLGKKGSWDMTYEAAFGENGVGWKAQEVLGKVKGARFTHEKNKRKRSTYRGGSIDDMAVNSIKYPSDSD
jgi:hypothetical protein|tara:strand:+ start:545 stop:835 length:291 start_codon:yes stop_codon:yes gene_type:complete